MKKVQCGRELIQALKGSEAIERRFAVTEKGQDALNASRVDLSEPHYHLWVKEYPSQKLLRVETFATFEDGQKAQSKIGKSARRHSSLDGKPCYGNCPDTTRMVQQ
jgi:hypothetical protein